MLTEQSIIARILDVLPAQSFEMLTFFSLFRVRFSDRVETACVTCREAPEMLLNREFVETRCKTGEHLLMLVLHELYHVILGHTRLFPRTTRKLNIIFDAVINAHLCSLFPGQEYTSFFSDYYPSDKLPFALLRPPGEGTPSGAEEALRLLYGQSGCATYYDVAQALADMPDAIFVCVEQRDGMGDSGGSEGDKGAGSGDGDDGDGGASGGSEGDKGGDNGDGGGDTGNSGDMPVLLGSHGKGEGEAPSPELKELLDKVIAKWPCPDRLLPGRDMGSEERERDFQEGSAPGEALTRAMRSLLRRASLPGPVELRRRAILERRCETTGFLPAWTDRSHEAREVALGEALLWRDKTTVRRPTSRDRRQAYVYLDVSGSLQDMVATLAGAIRPYARRRLCAVHVFSTVVAETDVGQLAASRFRTTGGTDINCVLEHVLSLPARKRPKAVVVVTDGYTGRPAPTLAERFRASGMKMYVGLVEGHRDEAMRDLGDLAEQPMTPLPV